MSGYEVVSLVTFLYSKLPPQEVTKYIQRYPRLQEELHKLPPKQLLSFLGYCKRRSEESVYEPKRI